MQTKTETKFSVPSETKKDAISDAGKRIREDAAVVIFDEDKIAWRLAEARSLIDRVIKKTKDRQLIEIMAARRKDLFEIEDYFYQIAVQKFKEHEKSIKQPELFASEQSPTTHGI